MTKFLKFHFFFMLATKINKESIEKLFNKIINFFKKYIKKVEIKFKSVLKVFS